MARFRWMVGFAACVGVCAAQGPLTASAGWRFVSGVFQVHEIVLVPCPDAVAGAPETTAAPVVCGHYRWGGEALQRNWEAMADGHPNLAARSTDGWRHHDGALAATFAVAGEAVDVRVEGSLVVVRLRGGR